MQADKTPELIEWEETYERLRDELGHWRIMLARGLAPREQVTVLEDRLTAHLCSKP